MSNLLENYYNNQKSKTILGKTTSFNGRLSFKDSLKINGAFIGEINADGVLVVGEDAVVQANVEADTVVVLGTIKGDVHAKSKVEMEPTGRVYGNVKARKIKISDGVIFNGRCEIIRDAK